MSIRWASNRPEETSTTPVVPGPPRLEGGRHTTVADVMRTDPPTITPDTTLTEVLEIAWHRGIRHLLVMDGTALVGIISDRDLKRVLTVDGGVRSSTTAGDIMTRTVITISPTTMLTTACDRMMQEAISALPVLQDGEVRGLITETEILAHLARSA